jgi:hypothetical protein
VIGWLLAILFVQGSLEGVVVRAGTSDPLQSIDLELMRVEGTKAFPVADRPPAGPGQPAAIPADFFTFRTGSDGRFRFTNLPPGAYRLMAAYYTSEYWPTEYGQFEPHGRGSRITVAEDESVRNVTLEMIPTGSISGRVLDENGNPAARVRVMAIESRWQQGRQELQIAAARYTDDLGEFRLFWLPPARYYISAQPDDPRRRALSLIELPTGAETTRETAPVPHLVHRLNARGETVTELLSPVYYGGNADFQTARLVPLAPGASVSNVDMALGAGRVPIRKIAGRVVDMNGQPVKDGAIALFPLLREASVVSPAVLTGADGSFELTIGTGAYLLRATQPGIRCPRPEDALICGGIAAVGSKPSAFLQIPASPDSIADFTVILKPPVEVRGRVIVEGPKVTGNEADTLGIRIRLTPELTEYMVPPAVATSGGAFAVPAVFPGDYSVNVLPFHAVSSLAGAGPVLLSLTATSPLADYYVKSMRLGPLDVLNDGLHLTSPPDRELEIILGANGGVLDGQVDDPTRGGVANATVVLVPEGARPNRIDLVKNVNTDRAGHFAFRGIAPGEYRLYAWQRIEEGIWFDPEFMRANRTRGTPVKIGEGANPKVNITVVRP